MLACSFSRKYGRGLMRYCAIWLKSRMASSLLPWCEAGWNGVVVPLSGWIRFEASRPILNETTRVMSVWKASTCRSNISSMCSAKESGTPAGASGSSRCSPLELNSSTF